MSKINIFPYTKENCPGNSIYHLNGKKYCSRCNDEQCKSLKENYDSGKSGS